MPHILLVDDSPIVRLAVAAMLQGGGHTAREAGDGATALALVQQDNPALLVVDVSMPGMDGIAFVKELRRLGHATPVLFLSTYGDVEKRVQCLESGGDDYITKPCDPRELLARVAALLRRGSPRGGMRLRFDDLVVDLTARTAVKSAGEVELTKTEFTLLTALARNAGAVTTRERLLAEVWGYAEGSSTRTLETHIWRLRKKIGDDADHPRWIVNRAGMGYELAAETIT